MSERLVYSPKCYAFVKNVNEEIMDLTEYVVGGEIKRLINQVSTAKLVLRNPDRIFTRPKEVAFHPQDPITIFLERTPGHPVQVFTGFLDTVPYYQMRPGPITLEASCTLKKLLYTWYQLAQPYTLSLLEHFGWLRTKGPEGIVLGPVGEVTGPTKGTKTGKEEQGQGTELSSKWAAKAGQEGYVSPKFTPFGSEEGGALANNDGSFANLLWAILYYIGDWQEEKIWIENVPSSVPKLINSLWNDFEQNNKEAQEEINAFWSAAIGVGSYGSGGGPGGGELGASGSGGTAGGSGVEKEILSFWLGKGFSANAAAGFVGNAAQESSLTPGAGGGGLYQQSGHAGEGTGSATQQSEQVFNELTASQKSEINAAKTPAEAARIIMEVYEEPQIPRHTSVPVEDLSKREQAATEAAKNIKPTGAPLKGGVELAPEETQRSGKTEKTGTGKRSRLDEMISRASEISNKEYPYAWGGGHTKVGSPSMGESGGPAGSSGVLGFDCSGSVLAVLAAGGFVPTGSTFGSSGEMMHVYGHIGEPGPGPKGKGVTIYANATHEWMTINGRYFSTGWNKNAHGGAGWGGEQESEWPSVGEYESMHLSSKQLEETYTGAPPPALAGTEGESTVEGSNANSILSTATAAAFASNISAPGAQEIAEASIFGGQKALMNSKQLLQFVQQVSQASLRSFQSLPNGDFYAFYPDYFGEFGHHDAYWLIYDVEVLEGGIDLSDDNLVTHVFSLGNPIYPANPTSNPLVIEQKAGVMTIFEAMEAEGILYNTEQEKVDQKRPGVSNLMNSQEAVEFLKRYGPRVLREEYPLVTSTIYECLLAYQQFLLGWSRQFITPFTFTFMPELFPGGKVGFPEHGMQMYIESVTHTWDTTNGYTTVAQLSAPSVLQAEGQIKVEGKEDLPPNMVDALIEPLRKEVKKNATAPPQRPALPTKTKPDILKRQS